jgi:hypothetical protein
MLVAPRRGALIIAKVIGIAAAGIVLSGLTFGLGLATVAADLAAHHIHHLPADTGRLFAGAVVAATLFGVIGVALGYLTRSTIAAVVGAVGWVLFAELAILHTLAPHLAKWLVTGAATALTNPTVPGSSALTPVTAVAVLSGSRSLSRCPGAWTSGFLSDGVCLAGCRLGFGLCRVLAVGSRDVPLARRRDWGFRGDTQHGGHCRRGRFAWPGRVQQSVTVRDCAGGQGRRPRADHHGGHHRGAAVVRHRGSHRGAVVHGLLAVHDPGEVTGTRVRALQRAGRDRHRQQRRLLAQLAYQRRRICGCLPTRSSPGPDDTRDRWRCQLLHHRRLNPQPPADQMPFAASPDAAEGREGAPRGRHRRAERDSTPLVEPGNTGQQSWQCSSHRRAPCGRVIGVIGPLMGPRFSR